MSTPAKVNGTAHPAPTFTKWPVVDQHPITPDDTPAADPIAAAKAAAIRAEGDANAEAIRIKAEEDVRIRRARAERKDAEEKAASEARIAESNRQRDETERARREAAAADQAQQRQEQSAAVEQENTDRKWRSYALGFYVVCAIVALPVQVAAFWSPSAPWLIVAPLMLEGGAWVVLKGAAAAVANQRPHWHYRLIAWVLAVIAAGVNLVHGLAAFDAATAVGTALASIAGPGVWDLHEHGRILGGTPSRRERKAAEKAAKDAARQKAAEDAAKAAEEKAAEDAETARATGIAEARAEHFPKVWERAVKLAAAMGEATVTDTVWRRAHLDVEGCEPGDTADVIRARNAAARRVEAASSGEPVNRAAKGTKAQVARQMPDAPRKRVIQPPARRGVRRKGDTPRYSTAARKAASITAREASLAKVNGSH